MTSRDPKGAVRQCGRLSQRQFGFLFLVFFVDCDCSSRRTLYIIIIVSNSNRQTRWYRSTDRVTAYKLSGTQLQVRSDCNKLNCGRTKPMTTERGQRWPINQSSHGTDSSCPVFPAMLHSV